MKKAYIFPGQGSQFVGMGKDLYDASPLAKSLFEEANHILGFAITDVMFAGDEESLKQTRVTQPAIFLHSVILRQVLGEAFTPDMVAGHSLGEFSALVASGVLTFEQGLRLVAKRAEAMQKACELQKGTMAAILGLPAEEIEKICTEIDGTVEAVNFNEPKQTVIAGEKKAIEKSLDVFKEKGAKRAIPLAVSGPFHSSLMKPVAEKLKQEFENYTWNDAEISLVANTTANILTSADEIKEELYRQTFGPVKWVDTINKLAENGVTKIYEIGPGKVLAGLIKKINKNIEVINIENVEAINTLVI